MRFSVLVSHARMDFDRDESLQMRQFFNATTLGGFKSLLQGVIAHTESLPDPADRRRNYSAVVLQAMMPGKPMDLQVLGRVTTDQFSSFIKTQLQPTQRI